MFDIGFGEIAVIAVLGLFIFGPDRLPKLIADATRTLRQVRQMATQARQEITDSIDPELQGIDLAGLNPKEFMRRTLLDDDGADVLGSIDDDKRQGSAGQRAQAERDAARRSEATSANGSGAAAASNSSSVTPAPWDPDTT